MNPSTGPMQNMAEGNLLSGREYRFIYRKVPALAQSAAGR